MPNGIRASVLGWWAGFVSRHPYFVVGAALLGCAFSLLICFVRVPLGPWHVGPLAFQSDRNSLIGKSVPWMAEYIRWQKNFDSEGDSAVAVDLHATRDAADYNQRVQRARAAVDQIGPALAARPDLAARVTWRYEARDFSGKALRMQRSMQAIDQALDELVKAAPQLKQPMTAPSLADLLDPAGRDTGLPTPDDVKGLTALINQINASTTRPSDHFDLEKVMSGGQEREPNYLDTDNGRMLFVRFSTVPNPKTGEVAPAQVAAIRKIVDDATAQQAGIDGCVAGGAIMDTDETQVAERDGQWTGAVAFVLIYLVLAASQMSLRGPLLSMLALAFGICWAFGWATIAVGHLQVISVIFTVPLLGLGVAYGVYIQSRYELVRREHPDNLAGFEQALRDSLQTMGPGVITGCLTTACAFMTTIFTHFQGVAEMGLIAGGGVVLCLIAMFCVFPALLRIFRADHKHVHPPARRRFDLFDERWVMPFIRSPRATLTVGVGLLVASCVALASAEVGWSDWKFDYNVMHLQPKNSPSVACANHIDADGGETIWTAYSVVPNTTGLSREELLSDTPRGRQAFDSLFAEVRKRKAALEKLKTVKTPVRGVGLLIPDDDDQKLAKIAAARTKIPADVMAAVAQAAERRPAQAAGAHASQAATSQPAASPARGDRLAQVLHKLSTLLPLFEVRAVFNPPLRAAIADARNQLRTLLANLDVMPPDLRTQALARIEADYAASRHAIARQVLDIFDPSPLTPRDVAPDMLRPYIGKDGSIALEISPNNIDASGHPVSPLESDFLHRYTQEVWGVDPDVTGNITQIWHSGELIKNAYTLAGALAFGVVFLIITVGFRSVRDTMVTLVPVAVGFAMTFGIMWLGSHFVDMPSLTHVNMGNIIVLPLMFGIGVDSGVNVIYRFRDDPLGKPPGLTAGTGKAVTVTNLAAVIGFGVLMLASHRGIVGLGFILAVGMTLTMLSCWALMPAWLELRARKIEAVPAARPENGIVPPSTTAEAAAPRVG